MSRRAVMMLGALLGAFGAQVQYPADPVPRSPEDPDPDRTDPGECRRCGGTGRTRTGEPVAEHPCPDCRRRSRR